MKNSDQAFKAGEKYKWANERNWLAKAYRFGDTCKDFEKAVCCLKKEIIHRENNNYFYTFVGCKESKK